MYTERPKKLSPGGEVRVVLDVFAATARAGEGTGVCRRSVESTSAGSVRPGIWSCTGVGRVMWARLLCRTCGLRWSIGCHVNVGFLCSAYSPALQIRFCTIRTPRLLSTCSSQITTFDFSEMAGRASTSHVGGCKPGYSSYTKHST